MIFHKRAVFEYYFEQNASRKKLSRPKNEIRTKMTQREV